MAGMWRGAIEEPAVVRHVYSHGLVGHLNGGTDGEVVADLCREHVHRVRDGFLIVVLFWTVLAIFGAFPLLLSADLDISMTDALFESMFFY